MGSHDFTLGPTPNGTWTEAMAAVLEALDVIGIVGQVRVEDLERYYLPGLAVPRPVDGSLPTSGDPIENPVPAYPLLRHRAPLCAVGQSNMVMHTMLQTMRAHRALGTTERLA